MRIQRSPLSVIVMLLASLVSSACAADRPASEWVQRGADGKLTYKTTPAGDRIMDFSHAGYRGGGVALPEVAVKNTVKPSGGEDDTKLIQAAIDEVAKMSRDENGFRGAVLLAPGEFPCAETITITASGVVLRGSGSGGAERSTIKMTGKPHLAIAARMGGRRGGGGAGGGLSASQPTSRDEASGVQSAITDAYVPSGVMSFTLADAKGFNVGDAIAIRRPVTKSWVEFMQMHDMTRNGKPQTCAGPVGIWAFDASRIVIQKNESYANKTGGRVDGGGFDLDGGVTDSIMQYNYSHDNDGPGFLLFTYSGARPWGRNIVRYNISQNDARKNDVGAILIGGTVNNSVIEHNTVFIKPSTISGATAAGIRVKGAGSSIFIRNNILHAAGGPMLIRADSNYTGVHFTHNNYWTGAGGGAAAGAFRIKWGATTYTSLSSWRTASGKEKGGTLATGHTLDPKLNSVGTGGTLNDATKLESLLTKYQLRADSPLRAAASAATPSGSAGGFAGYVPATRDFFARAISGKREIGAAEG